MKDITFVIQGPANRISIENIPCLLEFGEVILSCYAEDDISGYPIPAEVRVVKSPFPRGHPFLRSAANAQNGFLQAYTTLNGLRIVETDFSIKVRSDERFTEFSRFIEAVKAAPQKFTTINFCFRKDSHYKFHPSDHLFGSTTKLLKEAFENLIAANLLMEGLPIESKIFLSFLQAKGVETDWASSSDITRSNSQIIRLQEMGDFTISVNCKNNYKSPVKYYRKDIQFIEEHEREINANTVEEI